MIQYTSVSADAEIEGILALQRANLPVNLTPEQLGTQGFVTVQHEFSVLKKMNAAEPSSIAKDGETVVGYCLAMTKAFRQDIPVLVPIFELFDALSADGKPLAETSYIVVGQVCIAVGYRGQGLLRGMYDDYRRRFSAPLRIGNHRNRHPQPALA